MSVDSRIRRALSTTGAVDKLLRRGRCQIDFAKAIDDGRFTEAIASAEGVLDRTDLTNLTEPTKALTEAVAEAENVLAEAAGEAKTFTIHCVGHGHIDMNWMWSWPETCATTHDTFASVLSLMEQYPDLTYSQSQASVYALVEKYHPAMFEQIKQRVKEGRWEVAAVHWVEGDKNLASGESLAHHLLYTRQYFAEKFGLTPEDCQLDWEPDTFGHCNTLPGILKQGGVKYYYCCRPGGGQEHLRIGEERPPVFWWQSPDGSRVLVNKETTWYNSYVEIGDNFALPAAAFFKKTGLRDWLNVYGIGNHGGGPTREEIEYFIETRDWPCWPNVVFGTAQGWFRKVEPLCGDMPVLDHELNYEFTGCYTSQSAIKKANRYGENYCVEAETLRAIAFQAMSGSGFQPEVRDQGLEAPDTHRLEGAGPLREAWINVLFNQFHDILPGSGVAATRNHALGLFQETGAITGAIKRNALQAIARDLNTVPLIPDTPEGREERANLVNTPFEAGSGQGAGESGFSRASGGGTRFRPVMIYNPCAWVRSEMVEVNLYDLPADIAETDIVALDEEGVAHPTLAISSIAGGNHDWGHRRTTVLFHAKDIPALGYRTFLFCEGFSRSWESEIEIDSETSCRTSWADVNISKYGSGISELTLSNERVVKDDGSALGQWTYVVERPKGMSAWQLSFEQLSGDYLEGFGPSFRLYGGIRNEATDLKSGSNFAVLASQKLLVLDTSSSVQLRTLISDHNRIDWLADIDWREIGDGKRGIPGLQIDFPTRIDRYKDPCLIFETPFGIVKRIPQSGGQEDFPWEVPSLRFAHQFGAVQNRDGTTSGGSGMTLVQDCKYGFGAGNWRGLTMRVLRSSYDPDHAPEVAKSTMRYALVFHDTEPTHAELVRLGAAFNHPLIVTPVLLQEGTQPTKRGFAEVQTECVVLSTLKLAEKGDGLVVRLVNYSHQEVEAVVQFDSEFVWRFSSAVVADLMERPTAGTATLKGCGLRVGIESNSFVTVVLR
jgi:alpha-mannosidase